MDFQFELPRNNKELLNSDGNNYFVKQIYHVNEIPNQLRAANQAFQNSDAFYIFDHFDTFFSVIENASKMQMNQLIRAIDILYNTGEKYGQMIGDYLKKTELNEPTSYLNLTKMVMYLLVSTVRAIDVAAKNDTNETGAKKGKKTSVADAIPKPNWDGKRYQVLVQIFNIMQMPLEKLWNMLIVEEEFINMICDLGYRTLTHPTIKERRVTDVVFQILGIAIKQYNHALAFPVQIIQILEREEIAVSPIAYGVQLLAEEYNVTSIFNVLLKEFVEKLNVTQPDQLASKNFSLFLTEVSELSSTLVVPHLSAMSEELLNLEPYVIRNCVLNIMGRVIIRELTAETLEEEQKETRDEFLEDLLNHLNDVNSYVRSKVLQIWNEMKVEGAVPLAWHLKVIRMAVERLEDKTATVRKNAVTLLKSFLETNPFAAKLSLQEIEAKFEEESNKLQAIREKMLDQEKNREEIIRQFEEECKPALEPILRELLAIDCASDIDEDTVNKENVVERVRDHLMNKEYKEVAQLIIPLDYVNRETRRAMPIQNQCLYFLFLLNSYLFNDYGTEFDVKASCVGFLMDSLEFSKIITQAVPKLEMLLMSTTNTDVFEAIDFFTTGYLFKIKGTESGMRRMLSLVWTGDKDKRNAVTKAYNQVLFQTDAEGRAHNLKVVENLFHFFSKISIGEYSAMESMMKEWIVSNVIDTNIIQVFFERFTLKLPDTSDDLSRCCLQFIILAATAKPSVVTSNKELITSICIGQRSLNDPRIFAACLELLVNSIPAGTSFYQRCHKDETTKKITEIFKKVFFFPRVPEFELVASKIIGYYYHLCQAPDILSQELLSDICQKLKVISEKRKEKLLQALSEDDVAQSQQIEFHVPDYLLARLIYVTGFIALKEMIFLDIDVYNNMKYREDLKREKKDLKKKWNKRKTHTNPLNSSASDVLKRLTTSAAEPQQEPDEMLVGATADDSIAELVNQICENELICSPAGLLHQFVPIITEILNQPAKFRDEHIQQAACTTLIRFMTVSAKFCNENIPFLMNIMQKTKNANLKCNIIIGLTDFTCRFPNVIEPWTANLYATLLEKDDAVRLTAVKCLSYLILQEMIRVRGQLSDMAVCIIDDNEEIRSVTKEFFKGIKEKSNILYNVLPDIISRLSAEDTQLEEEKFRIIMQNIIGLIEKDRQIESLVEKLSLRFHITSSERQWRDIAFCLSLLKHTEKTLKKLIDNSHYFRDKIQLDEVLDCFKTIISNANKPGLKGQLKTIAKELENKINEFLTVKEEGDDGDKNAVDQQQDNDHTTATSPAPVRGKKRGQKFVPKPKRRNNRYASSEDSDFEAPAATQSLRRSTNSADTSRSSSRNEGKRTVHPTNSDEDRNDRPVRTRQRRI